MSSQPMISTDSPPITDTTLCSSADAAPALVAELRAALAAQVAENSRLARELNMRDRALDSTETEFAICKIADPVSLIIYCNRALAEHHGYERNELLDRPITDLAPADSAQDEHVRLRAKLALGETVRFEKLAQRKDGTTYIRGATLIPLKDEQGQLTHSLSIGADITIRLGLERKQRELQEQLVNEMKERENMAIELRLAQKLESVGRLAAGVAHEINTPIQFVNDSLYFLKSAFDDLDKLINTFRESASLLANDHNSQNFLAVTGQAVAAAELEFLQQEIPKAFERTFDGANRVASIVRAMKEFAHPDAIEHSPADINHALQTTLIVASNEYKYSAAVKTAFAELPPVICNIGELNQVFLNLIVNAAHAIHDAGKGIEQGVITVDTAVVGTSVEITIGDNGCGIPSEHLEKIYDPFFTTKEVGRGTGQGLAITRSIVIDKHGGDIRVNSGVGSGTRFTLCLPIEGRKLDSVEAAL